MRENVVYIAQSPTDRAIEMSVIFDGLGTVRSASEVFVAVGVSTVTRVHPSGAEPNWDPPQHSDWGWGASSPTLGHNAGRCWPPWTGSGHPRLVHGPGSHPVGRLPEGKRPL